MPEPTTNGSSGRPPRQTNAPPARYGFDTRAVHAGQRPDPYTGARAMPIYQTTSYVFEDSSQAAAIFNLHEYGNTYARIMNPTVAAFEERVANLEGGIGAVATASGLSAQYLAFYTMLRPGDHVVASRALYGGSTTQFKHAFARIGLDVTFVDPDDPDAWRSALRAETRALYGETIGNPSGNILDIEPLAALAHDHGAVLVVDNTFASPYLCRPLEWGADVVLHSATKFIGGHGTSIGGVVVESGDAPWGNGHFPNVTEPSPAYHGLAFQEAFGMYGFLTKLRAESLRDLGATLAPFNAFLFLLGLETLPLRMQRHVDNALAVAQFLRQHPVVETVRHPGLPDSPYAPLVHKYLPLGAGAVFSFDIRGGRAAGLRFVESLELFSHLANVGDAKSLVIHPGSTTHRQLSEAELLAMGIGPGTIRLSVGLETAADLIADLDYALTAAGQAAEIGARP